MNNEHANQMRAVLTRVPKLAGGVRILFPEGSFLDPMMAVALTDDDTFTCAGITPDRQRIFTFEPDEAGKRTLRRLFNVQAHEVLDPDTGLPMLSVTA